MMYNVYTVFLLAPLLIVDNIDDDDSTSSFKLS